MSMSPDDVHSDLDDLRDQLNSIASDVNDLANCAVTEVEPEAERLAQEIDSVIDGMNYILAELPSDFD